MVTYRRGSSHRLHYLTLLRAIPYDTSGEHSMPILVTPPAVRNETERDASRANDKHRLPYRYAQPPPYSSWREQNGAVTSVRIIGRHHGTRIFATLTRFAYGVRGIGGYTRDTCNDARRATLRLCARRKLRACGDGKYCRRALSNCAAHR